MMAINPILAVASKPKRMYRISYLPIVKEAIFWPIVEGATFLPLLLNQRAAIEAIFSEVKREQEEMMADRKELKNVNKKL
jgi:hypothetical protein